MLKEIVFLKYTLQKLNKRIIKCEAEIKELEDGYEKIIISDKIISTENKFQYFKTTNRDLYSNEHRQYYEKGFFDVIFINEKQQVAEGAITNIFIRKVRCFLYFTHLL